MARGRHPNPNRGWQHFRLLGADTLQAVAYTAEWHHVPLSPGWRLEISPPPLRIGTSSDPGRKPAAARLAAAARELLRELDAEFAAERDHPHAGD